MHGMTTPLVLLGALFLATLALVVGNDAGAPTEVALLEGNHVVLTNDECDAMYHAIWRVKQEPSHSTLIDIAKGLDCPFDE